MTEFSFVGGPLDGQKMPAENPPTLLYVSQTQPSFRYMFLVGKAGVNVEYRADNLIATRIDRYVLEGTTYRCDTP